MVNEKMSDVEQMTLLISLQKEMVDMKTRNEKTKQMNEDEILALRKENEEMKKKFVEGGPSCTLSSPDYFLPKECFRPGRF